MKGLHRFIDPSSLGSPFTTHDGIVEISSLYSSADGSLLGYLALGLTLHVI